VKRRTTVFLRAMYATVRLVASTCTTELEVSCSRNHCATAATTAATPNTIPNTQALSGAEIDTTPASSAQNSPMVHTSIKIDSSFRHNSTQECGRPFVGM
jgi:hypothetical protein